MNRHWIVTTAAALGIGFFGGQAFPGRSVADASQSTVRPAYMVISSRAIHPDKMGPYRKAAGPLATKAGIETIASGNPALQVLEGSWTLPGELKIERYRSMDALLEFWNSRDYQEAKKLRQGLSEISFIVAIEGR